SMTLMMSMPFRSAKTLHSCRKAINYSPVGISDHPAGLAFNRRVLDAHRIFLSIESVGQKAPHPLTLSLQVHRIYTEAT
ncbi:MAG: hypothetical protein ACLQDI_14760, partial [Syntrophobacteraceae bacterium]